MLPLLEKTGLAAEDLLDVDGGLAEICTRPILERNELAATDVLDVAEGRAIAIVVRDYYLPEACREIAKRLKATSFWTTYAPGTGAEHIGTLGAALYGCLGEEFSEPCQSYFDKAPRRNQDLREAIRPYLLPADRVCIELDHEWEFGASLLRIGGRPTFFGLCRIVRVGGLIEPHTDRADWDVPSPETSVFRAQLFLNIYLEQAEMGGDLELWDYEVPTKSDYDELRSATTSYALDRGRLPSPVAKISVEPGTLVIANASKPHAVTPCGGTGERLSVSGFIGFAGADRPLRVFS